MKKIVLVISLFTCIIVSAQVDSLLFGLSLTTTGSTLNPVSNIYLTRVNAGTGVLTNAATSATTGGLQVGNSTIDSYNKVYYFIRGGNEMVGISLYTGAVVSSNTLSFSNGAYLHNMYFNCGDTTIYAIARTVATGSNAPTANMYLAKVNPNTGLVTNISTNSIGSSLQLNNVTIDPYNKIYYYVTQSLLVGLSLTTGTVVSSALLNCPTSNISFLYSGIFYNRSDSTLYGLARAPATVSNMPSSASIYLAKVTSGGIVSVISPTSLGYSYQVANSSIDPYQKVYYFVNGSHQLIGVSLLNGLTVTSPTITNSSGSTSFLEMNYNCNLCPEPKQEIVTSIKNNTNNQQILIYPNPAAKYLFVEMEKAGNYGVEVRDICGRLILNTELKSANKLELNLDHVEKGLYLLNISSHGQKTISHKFLIGE